MARGKVIVPIEVKDDVISNTLERANSLYWCYIERYPEWSEIKKGKKIKLAEGDGSMSNVGEKVVYHLIDKAGIINGLSILASRYPQDFVEMITENGDCYTGDALIQCSIFGEIKYS